MKVVDLFAGWSGFTIGAELAGARVVYAANHWPLAVEAHRENHAGCVVVCQDLRQADWTTLPPGYDMLIGGPACQGHSPASQPQRRPYHDAMRATAWAMVDCAEVTRPRAFAVENVPAFARWALFDLWCDAFKRLGYAVQTHRVCASHHGVPQRRTRLFVTGTLGGRRVEIRPSSTEPAFGPHVQWDAPGWREARSPNVALRIARSRVRHGQRFLSQHTTDHMGVSLDEPIRTVTTKDQWIVVDGDRYRGLTEREVARAMSFPDSYRVPASATRADMYRGFGNAVPPLLARAVVGAVAEAA